jgi:hypothetical protein
MFAILVHRFLNWFDAAQSERWESRLEASSNLNQVENRIRELEGSRPTF